MSTSSVKKKVPIPKQPGKDTESDMEEKRSTHVEGSAGASVHDKPKRGWKKDAVKVVTAEIGKRQRKPKLFPGYEVDYRMYERRKLTHLQRSIFLQLQVWLNVKQKH